MCNIMKKNTANKFIQGAVILSAAGLISKLMGFGYRIVLPRVIGDQGIALYQLAYPIYTTLLVVSRSGIPVALAKMISDRIARNEYRSAFRIFKVGRKLSVLIGGFFFVLMLIMAAPVVNILRWDSRALYTILAISPAVFFVSIMATYRGFFQGLQDMVPTAYSQVVEQFVRMTTMIILVYLLIPHGVGLAAAGATFGAVTGSIAGLLILFYIYYRRRKKIWKYVNTGSVVDFNTREIIKEMAALGIPVTFGALVLPLMSLVDAAIVPWRLSVAGFENALGLFGQLSGMALVLVNFPAIITISLAASLVPAISEAFALGDDNLIKRRTETALRLTLLIGLPASTGLFILAQPLTSVIFNNIEAAIPLRIVAWGVIFITLQQTTSAILQGIGKTIIPARNLFIGAIINGIINFSLTALPQFGIRGAALGTVTGFAIAALFNIWYVKRYTGFKIRIKTLLLKPLIAVLIMAIITKHGFELFLNVFPVVFKGYSYAVSTILIVFIAAFSYFFLLLLLGEIKHSDLILIPGIGEKIADNLKKLGLVGE